MHTKTPGGFQIFANCNFDGQVQIMFTEDNSGMYTINMQGLPQIMRFSECLNLPQGESKEVWTVDNTKVYMSNAYNITFLTVCALNNPFALSMPLSEEQKHYISDILIQARRNCDDQYFL